jgi:nitroimidazol reductase NimA-like FMN-containing flavoprotein (pyridoxamine 5'-phosphate oxidase superfamily)
MTSERILFLGETNFVSRPTIHWNLLMGKQFATTELNQVKRVPNRGAYDRETVFRVIDAAWMGHVGILNPTGGVTVIPMLHAIMDDSLIFHGAKSSRLMKYLGSGDPVSVSFGMVDGLVLAKSLFHHSMNYRSAVIFGTGQLINDAEEVLKALKAISDKIMPGRWDDARQPNQKELSATAVVKLEIDSASAKIRTGDPVDDKDDFSLPVWSGILPIRSSFGRPISDANSDGTPVPEYFELFTSRYNQAEAAK